MLYSSVVTVGFEFVRNFKPPLQKVLFPSSKYIIHSASKLYTALTSQPSFLLYALDYTYTLKTSLVYPVYSCVTFMHSSLIHRRMFAYLRDKQAASSVR